MIRTVKIIWWKSLLWTCWFLAVAACSALTMLSWAMVSGIDQIGFQEDAMIGLRHLRNLVEGDGLYYSPGYGVVAVTSPIFWLGSSLSAFLHRLLGVDATLLEMHARFCMATVVVTLSLVPIALGRRGGLVGLAVFTLLFALLLWPLRFNFLGLEGFMLLFALLAMQLAARCLTPIPAFLLIGVLASVRPEFSIVVMISTLYFLLARARADVQLKPAVALVVGALIQPLLLLITTGHVIPHSIVGKSTFGQRSDTQLLDSLIDRLSYLDGFIGLGPGVALLLSLATIVIGTHAALSHISRPRTVEDLRGVVKAVAAGYTSFIFLSPSLWEWYASFWLLLTIYAIAVAFAELTRETARRASGTALLPVAGLMFLFCAVTFAVARLPAAHQHNHAVKAWLLEERLFRGRLGRDLAERWDAESVWMEAVGWQGYFNRARVIDEVGLASPEVVDVVDESGCGYFVEGLKRNLPQFIVKRRFEVESNRMMTPPVTCPGAPLFQDESARQWFNQHYEQVASYDSRTPEYFGPYSHLLLFRRLPDEK